MSWMDDRLQGLPLFELIVVAVAVAVDVDAEDGDEDNNERDPPLLSLLSTTTL